MNVICIPQEEPRLYCSFCGAEIAPEEEYWYVNAAAVCRECLPDFARISYGNCRRLRGREERL